MSAPEKLISSYLLVSPSVVLVYDYLLTVHLEVKYIWLSSFNWVTIVYLLQRYLPFADTLGLFLYGIFSPTISAQKCTLINYSGHWLHIVGFTLSESVLSARAYAACKIRFGSKRLLAFLTVLAVVFGVPIYLAYGFPSHVGNIGHETTSPSTACTIHSQTPLFFVVYVCAATHKIVILAMMMAAGYPTYKTQGFSQLFRVVYSYGIMYYAVLIFVLLANVVIIFNAPENFASLLMPLARILHATLTSRTVLHIREVASRRTSGIDIDSYDETDLYNSDLSMIHFSSQSASIDQDRTREVD
ncbi:hypothetical protein L218DRAFT_985157 [Marasmius fiardii PR-910]|nr:hypothetical protein L218DRAFT_985157 [Marasmius fiardii PR-910]